MRYINGEGGSISDFTVTEQGVLNHIKGSTVNSIGKWVGFVGFAPRGKSLIVIEKEFYTDFSNLRVVLGPDQIKTIRLDDDFVPIQRE